MVEARGNDKAQSETDDDPWTPVPTITLTTLGSDIKEKVLTLFLER